MADRVLCSCGCASQLSIHPTPPPRCSVCKSTFYVDRSHQQKHYKSHKRLCRFLASLRVGSIVYCAGSTCAVPRGCFGVVAGLPSALSFPSGVVSSPELPLCVFVSFEGGPHQKPVPMDPADLFWPGTSAGEDLAHESSYLAGVVNFYGAMRALSDPSSASASSYSVDFAMSSFRDSLSKLRRLLDEVIAPDDPLRPAARDVFARRSLFLSYCYFDSSDVSRGRAAVESCISCYDPPSSPTTPLSLRVLRDAYTELALSHESAADFAAARDAARRGIERRHVLWVDCMQRPGVMFPGLRSKAFWDVAEDFPRDHWLHKLSSDASFRIVNGEVKALLQGSRWFDVGSASHREGGHEHDGTVLSSGRWSEVVLFGRGASPSLAPLTRSLLEDICGPDVVSLAERAGGEVVLSRLAPGTVIKPHCAPSNHRLTCHLGVIVPDGADGGKCQIRVGDVWRGWNVGKCMVFDDSFEHEVVNTTKSERIVLLIRFWHPDLKGEGERDGALEYASKEREAASRARWITPLLEKDVSLENMLPFDESVKAHCACVGGAEVELRVQESKVLTPDLIAVCRACGKNLCLNTPAPKAPVRSASKTAIGVALQRALHMIKDGDPKILVDSIAPRLFSSEELDRAVSSDTPGTRLLRSHVVARSRFAEERLEVAVKERGVRQCVVLGAGLDTFAYRQPSWALDNLTVFEVDHPASQADKLSRLSAIGVKPPKNVRYVRVDFATTTLERGLEGHVDRSSPALFIWLGVMMYLDATAIRRVLDYVVSFPKRSEIVFSFAPVTSQAVFAAEGFSCAASSNTPHPSSMPSPTPIEAQAAAAGEPWLSKHRPEDLVREFLDAGFAEVDMLPPEVIAPWLGEAPRPDGLRVSDRTTIGAALVK